MVLFHEEYNFISQKMRRSKMNGAGTNFDKISHMGDFLSTIDIE